MVALQRFLSSSSVMSRNLHNESGFGCIGASVYSQHLVYNSLQWLKILWMKITNIHRLPSYVGIQKTRKSQLSQSILTIAPTRTLRTILRPYTNAS